MVTSALINGHPSDLVMNEVDAVHRTLNGKPANLRTRAVQVGKQLLYIVSQSMIPSAAHRLAEQQSAWLLELRNRKQLAELQSDLRHAARRENRYHLGMTFDPASGQATRDSSDAAPALFQAFSVPSQESHPYGAMKWTGHELQGAPLEEKAYPLLAWADGDEQ